MLILSNRIIKKIGKLRNQNKTYKEIGKILNIPRDKIHYIIFKHFPNLKCSKRGGIRYPVYSLRGKSKVSRLRKLEQKEKNKISNIKYNKSVLGKRRTQRFLENPRNRLNQNMATMILLALKRGKEYRNWQKLVGYDVNDLMKHLEKQFDDKMNWSNWGKFWEIDHKIPKTWFKFKKAEDKEFKKCWALKNLQPLEKSQNRSKNNHFISI